MHSVHELIDAARAHSKIQSDYRLAKTLEVTVHTVANWRHGRSKPDDISAFKLAELAGLDPLYSLACVQAERATKADVKTLWLSMAKRFEHGAAAVLAVILSVVLLTPSESQASASACYAGERPLTCAVPLSIHCGKLMAFCVVVAFCLQVCQKSTLFPFFARRPA